MVCRSVPCPGGRRADGEENLGHDGGPPSSPRVTSTASHASAHTGKTCPPVAQPVPPRPAPSDRREDRTASCTPALRQRPPCREPQGCWPPVLRTLVRAPLRTVTSRNLTTFSPHQLPHRTLSHDQVTATILGPSAHSRWARPGAERVLARWSPLCPVRVWQRFSVCAMT